MQQALLQAQGLRSMILLSAQKTDTATSKNFPITTFLTAACRADASPL